MIDTIMAGFVLFLIAILIIVLGWLLSDMVFDMFPKLNIFRGIKIKFSKRGCIDFIKAVYNMETNKEG